MAMEYSLTNPATTVTISFVNFFALLAYLQTVDRVDGWVLVVNHNEADAG